MRNMLLHENPFEYFRYGVLMYYFPESSIKMIDLIISPEILPRPIYGHDAYRALFNSVAWIFVLSDPTKDFPNRKFFLSPEGSLPIINSGYYGEKFVLELAFDFFGKKL
jgi:hypothetical protein